MRPRNEKLTRHWLREIIRTVPLEGSPSLRLIRRAPQGITRPGKGLGVLPSSFNPPTKAHQALIESARGVKPIDEVLLVLDRKPLDKRIFGATLEERISMILLCFEKDPTVSVAFTNRGRFVEKLELVMRSYPDNTIVRFIVGYDTLTRVLDEKYYENRDAALARLFADSEFLVATRGNAGVDDIERLILQERNRPFANKIIPFDIPLPIRQLSSTQIREKRYRGNEIGDLVPSEILPYMERRRLYRNRKPPAGSN